MSSFGNINREIRETLRKQLVDFDEEDDTPVINNRGNNIDEKQYMESHQKRGGLYGILRYIWRLFKKK